MGVGKLQLFTVLHVGLIAALVFSALFWFGPVSSTGMVTQTDDLSPLTIQTNLVTQPHADSDFVTRLALSVEGLDVSNGEKVSRAWVEIDHVKVDSDFEIKDEKNVYFSQLTNPPFTEDGPHTIVLNVETSTGREAVLSKEIEADRTPPSIELEAKGKGLFTVTIQDDGTGLYPQTLRVYSTSEDKQWQWSEDPVDFMCELDTPTKKICSFVRQMDPSENLLISSLDNAENSAQYYYPRSRNEILDAQNDFTQKKLLLITTRAIDLSDIEQGSFTGNDMPPIVYLQIFHLADDYPQEGWTLADKIAKTRAAYLLARQDLIDAMAPEFTMPYMLMNPTVSVYVRQGKYTPQELAALQQTYNLLTIDEVAVPAAGGNCVDPLYQVCIEKLHFGPNLHTTTDVYDWVVTKNNSMPGVFEAMKTFSGLPTYLPVIVVDRFQNHGQASGVTFGDYGSTYMKYTDFMTGGGSFSLNSYGLVMGHEFGHSLGLGHDSKNTDSLMAIPVASGRLEFAMKGRMAAIMKTDGLKPKDVGIVTPSSIIPGYVNDWLLDITPSRTEECAANYWGEMLPATLSTHAPGVKYCPLTYDRSNPSLSALDIPEAVSDVAGSTHNVAQVLQRHPYAIIRQCNIAPGPAQYTCTPVIGNGGTTVSVRVNANPVCINCTPTRGPTTSDSDALAPPPDPIACQNRSPGLQGTIIMTWACPADATCPDTAAGEHQDCAVQGNNCRCIPEHITFCGNGVVDGTEHCDPPGTACGVMVYGGEIIQSSVCKPDCTCGEIEPGP